VPWDRVEREGVLRLDLWTVNLLQTPTRDTVCEAAARGRSEAGGYAVRLRAAAFGLILIVSREGPDFRGVHEVALGLDDGPLASLPVWRQQMFGTDHAVMAVIPKQAEAGILGPLNAGRLFWVGLGPDRFSVPVTGFDDVRKAMAHCAEWRKTHPRGAIP